MDSFLIFNKRLQYKVNLVYNSDFLSIFEDKEEFSNFYEFLYGNLEFLNSDFLLKDSSFFGQVFKYFQYLARNDYFSEDNSSLFSFQKKFFEIFRFKDKIDKGFFFNHGDFSFADDFFFLPADLFT